MKLSTIRIFCLLTFGISLTFTHSTNVGTFRSSLHNKLTTENPVRVLLKESTPEETSWKLTSTKGFISYNPQTKQTRRLKKTDLTVTYEHGAFLLNGIRYTHDHLILVPIEGLLRCDSIPYDGYFSLHRTERKTSLVNHVDLEEYLASVLPYESIPSWPDEVQKALCIACRTYAVAKIQAHRERKTALHYDLKNTILDQVYKGHARKTNLKKIVNATKGIIITQEDTPILAMYSAVCGGIIPAEKKSSIYINAPYLKRNYACPHCKDQPLYTWKTQYTFKDLEKPLQRRFPGLGKLQDVAIESYDKAGVAQKIILTGSKKRIRMDAHDFRMLFYTIRSLCCTFSIDKGTLTAQGKGHGHHMGLCQWGAYIMAKKGFSYQDILSFYYPETTLTMLDSHLPECP